MLVEFQMLLRMLNVYVDDNNNDDEFNDDGDDDDASTCVLKEKLLHY